MLPSLLIVGVVLVPLCALFSGLTLGKWWSVCDVICTNRFDGGQAKQADLAPACGRLQQSGVAGMQACSHWISMVSRCVHVDGVLRDALMARW